MAGEEWGTGWRDLLKRAAFEIAIVVVGVLIALAVDKARTASEHRALAREARAAMREEIADNRGRLIAKLAMVSEAARLLAADPRSAARYVDERRNRSFILFDSAWTSAIQTDAIRWLSPAERRAFAEAYEGQSLSRDVERVETEKWTELAGIGPLTPAAEAEDRIRVWRAYADRDFLGACRQLWRYEVALGARIAQEGQRVCEGFRIGGDPRALYRTWSAAKPA